MFGGLSELAIDKAFQWYSSLMFVGPLLLISGAVLTLIGTHCKAGSILSLVGCLVLTLMVAYHSLLMLHREHINDGPPARPPYGLYAIAAIAVVLTLMADVGAVLFYRLASHTVANQNQRAV